MRLIIRVAGLVIGVLLSALLYWWMWTETGPFAWIASLFGALGNLGMRWTFVAMIIVWLAGLFLCVPILSRMVAGLRPNDEKARATADWGISTGILLVPVLVLLLCLKGAISGLISGQPVELKAGVLVQEAGWMPRNVKADPALWAMDGGLEPLRFPGTSSQAEELYVPVDMRLADNPKGARVFVKTDSETVKKFQGSLELQGSLIEGTLAYEPLPHRVRAEMKRRGWGAPVFAVVVQQHRKVTGYWGGVLVLHLVPLLVYVANRIFRGRPKTKKDGTITEPPAQDPATASSQTGDEKSSL